MRRKVSRKRLVEALTKHRGNMAAAGRDLGVTRQAVRDHVEKDPELRALVDEMNETRVDRAEQKLDEAVEAGEPWAIPFMLRTLGRKRGYGDSMDVTSGGQPIRFTIRIDGGDDGDDD